MFTMLLFLFVVGIGYLCGSICSAIIVSRLAGLPDPRLTGSGNPGATNILRVAGKKYAMCVLLSDSIKGALPVLFAKTIGVGLFGLSFTCFAAVIGHMYPVFFGFRGGKGVATAIGALLALHLTVGTLVIITWLLIIYITQFVSLASLISLCLSPWYALLILHDFTILPALFLIALFILYQHRTNINRLMNNKEPKINFKL